jgi:trans-aconitate 2-methyltransferase
VRAALDSYYQLLVPICSKIDLWQTIYVQGLRPFLEVLSPCERETFLSRYRAELSAAYPRQPNGKVLLRYPRLFFVVQK